MTLSEPAWRVKTRPCPFYQQGRCLFADSCNFLHNVSVKPTSDAIRTRPYRSEGSPDLAQHIITKPPLVTVLSPRSVRSPPRSPRMSGLLLALKDIIGEDPDDFDDALEEETPETHVYNSYVPAESSTAVDGFRSFPFISQENSPTVDRSGSSWASVSALPIDDDTLRILPSSSRENGGHPSTSTTQTPSHTDQPIINSYTGTADLLSPVDLSLRHLGTFNRDDYELPARDEDSIDSGYADTWKTPCPLVMSPPRPPSVNSTFDLLSSPFGAPSNRLSAFITRVPNSPLVSHRTSVGYADEYTPHDLSLDSPGEYHSNQPSESDGTLTLRPSDQFVDVDDAGADFEHENTADILMYPGLVGGEASSLVDEEQEFDELHGESSVDPSTSWEAAEDPTAVFLGMPPVSGEEVSGAIRRLSASPMHFLNAETVDFVDDEADGNSSVVSSSPSRRALHEDMEEEGDSLFSSSLLHYEPTSVNLSDLNVKQLDAPDASPPFITHAHDYCDSAADEYVVGDESSFVIGAPSPGVFYQEGLGPDSPLPSLPPHSSPFLSLPSPHVDVGKSNFPVDDEEDGNAIVVNSSQSNNGEQDQDTSGDSSIQLAYDDSYLVNESPSQAEIAVSAGDELILQSVSASLNANAAEEKNNDDSSLISGSSPRQVLQYQGGSPRYPSFARLQYVSDSPSADRSSPRANASRLGVSVPASVSALLDAANITDNENDGDILIFSDSPSRNIVLAKDSVSGSDSEPDSGDYSVMRLADDSSPTSDLDGVDISIPGSISALMDAASIVDRVASLVMSGSPSRNVLPLDKDGPISEPCIDVGHDIIHDDASMLADSVVGGSPSRGVPQLDQDDTTDELCVDMDCGIVRDDASVLVGLIVSGSPSRNDEDSPTDEQCVDMGCGIVRDAPVDLVISGLPSRNIPQPDEDGPTGEPYVDVGRGIVHGDAPAGLVFSGSPPRNVVQPDEDGPADEPYVDVGHGIIHGGASADPVVSGSPSGNVPPLDEDGPTGELWVDMGCGIVHGGASAPAGLVVGGSPSRNLLQVGEDGPIDESCIGVSCNLIHGDASADLVVSGSPSRCLSRPGEDGPIDEFCVDVGRSIIYNDASADLVVSGSPSRDVPQLDEGGPANGLWVGTSCGTIRGDASADLVASGSLSRTLPQRGEDGSIDEPCADVDRGITCNDAPAELAVSGSPLRNVLQLDEDGPTDEPYIDVDRGVIHGDALAGLVVSGSSSRNVLQSDEDGPADDPYADVDRGIIYGDASADLVVSGSPLLNVPQLDEDGPADEPCIDVGRGTIQDASVLADVAGGEFSIAGGSPLTGVQQEGSTRDSSFIELADDSFLVGEPSSYVASNGDRSLPEHVSALLDAAGILDDMDDSFRGIGSPASILSQCKGDILGDISGRTTYNSPSIDELSIDVDPSHDSASPRDDASATSDDEVDEHSFVVSGSPPSAVLQLVEGDSRAISPPGYSSPRWPTPDSLSRRSSSTHTVGVLGNAEHPFTEDEARVNDLRPRSFIQQEEPNNIYAPLSKLGSFTTSEPPLDVEDDLGLSPPDSPTAQFAYLANTSTIGNENDTIDSLYEVYSDIATIGNDGGAVEASMRTVVSPPLVDKTLDPAPTSPSFIRERVFTPPPIRRRSGAITANSTGSPHSLMSPLSSLDSPSSHRMSPFSATSSGHQSPRGPGTQSPDVQEVAVSNKVPFGFRHSLALGGANKSSLISNRTSRTTPLASAEPLLPVASGVDERPSPEQSPTDPSTSRLKPLRLSAILTSHAPPFSSRNSGSSSINGYRQSGNINRTSMSATSVSSSNSLSNNLWLSSARSPPIPEHTRSAFHVSHVLSSMSSDHLHRLQEFEEPQSAPISQRPSWLTRHETTISNHPDRPSSRFSEPTFGYEDDGDHHEDDTHDDTIRRPLPIVPHTAPVTRAASVTRPPMYAIATPRPTLMFAIASDDVEQVRQVLENGDAGPNDAVGPQSALAFALTNDQLSHKMDIVKTLLAYGADPSVLKSREASPPVQGSGPDPTPVANNQVLPSSMEMDPATKYYVSRADAPHTRRTSALIHRSFFRPLTRVRYELIGQDRALEQLFKVLSMHSRQLSVTPIVVLLCGPSGHGKSLLARKFGSLLDVPTHTVNMTTLRSTHDLWQSYSMSPYEKPTSCTLAEFLINNEGKRCVVVLDEIEKTEDEKTLWSLLMPWELGRCAFEASSRHIDVRNVIWLGTSNIGHELVFEHRTSREVPEELMTREEYVELMGLLRPRVSERLGASVLSRVTTVLPFVPFTEDEKKAICSEALHNLAGDEIRTLPTKVVESMITGALASYCPSEGARSLYRAVSNQLIDTI